MDELLARGQQLFAQGKFLDALRAYSDAVTLDPKCARAWSNRSACWCKLGKFEEALSDADEALEADSAFTKALGRRAAALQGLRRYEEAAMMYRKGLTVDAQNETYRAGLAEVTEQIRQGRGVVGQEAKNKFYFDRSVKEGKEAMVKGDYHEAYRHFSRAIELWSETSSTNDTGAASSPSSSSPLGVTARDGAVLFSNRSATCYRLQKYGLSEEDGRAAIKADASYARGYLRLAMALRSLQRLDEALTELNAALHLEPDNSAIREEQTSVAKEIAERDKSHAEQVREQQEKANRVVDDRRHGGDGPNGSVALDSGGIAAAMRRQAGPAHATTYVYCSFCNTYDHDRSECPVMRQVKKRTRE